jgi:cobalt-precorrin 5A hydrolase / precorrin-3B C17-methyltransferase
MTLTENISTTFITSSVANVVRSEINPVQPQLRVLWVGIGCRRGTSKQLIEAAIRAVCQNNNLAEKAINPRGWREAIAGIATIDLKADEAGLVAFCQEYQLPLRTFPAAVLGLINVPHPATVVTQKVGTPSVAEAAAIMAANGILRVTKQIFKPENQPFAVTVAIAQSQLEYIDVVLD